MPSCQLTILIDLDGTLVDSKPGIVASCKAALRALSHEPKPQLDWTAMIGPPIDEVMRSLLAQYDDDDHVAEAIVAYREHYSAIGFSESAAYSGIPEALDALLAAGAVLHVATSKRTALARRVLDHCGLTARLAGIYGAEAGGALDRKPELIAHLLQREGIAAKDCVMVGDRRFDITGAHANGVGAIGVLWGYGTHEELEQARADRLVDRPADLPSAVLNVLK